jgi:hypothetical protein
VGAEPVLPQAIAHIMLVENPEVVVILHLVM